MKSLMLLVTLPLAAQPIVPPGTTGVRLQFSQQGAASVRSTAGKLVHGFGIAGVAMCNRAGGDRTIHPEDVWQAAGSLGISWIDPSIGSVTMEHARQWSWNSVLLEIVDWGSSGAGVLGTTKVIKMGNGVAAALSLAGPLLFAPLKSKLTKAAPVDVSARVITRDIDLLPGKCASGLLLYHYEGAWKPREAWLL